jgi:nitrate reductase gamma subunit
VAPAAAPPVAGEPEGPGFGDAPVDAGRPADGAALEWRDTPEAIESQRLIVSGAVALGLGLLVGIGAVIMGTSDPCELSYGNSCQEAARDRAAWTMGGPAIGVVAIGGSVLGVGLWRRAQARRAR